jgi:hypothetical protein
MKRFERLVKDHILSTLPDNLDPQELAYRPNRFNDDKITVTLHTSLAHLDKRNTYLRMLSIDYSSAFNTILTDAGTKTALNELYSRHKQTGKHSSRGGTPSGRGL